MTPSSPVPAGPAKAQARPKPRAVRRTRTTSDAEASSSGYEGIKRTGAVKAKKSKAIGDEDSEVPSRTNKPSGKGKGKGKAGKGKGKAGDEELVEGEGASERTKGSASTTKATGKRKAEREAGSSRAGSLQPAHTSTASTSGEAVPRKKKRTINIFGSAQDTTFEWGALSQVRCCLSWMCSNVLTMSLQGDTGLGIPTVLSPLQDSNAAPNRSASILGRMGSVIGSFRR